MSYVALGVGVGGAALKYFTGSSQKRQGNQLLGQIGEQPMQQMPVELLQNQEQAQLNANKGLPSAQYNQAMQNIQRQQMMALNGANDRRAGILTVANNQSTGDTAAGNIDVANAKARLQNQNTLYGVNNRVAQMKNQLFQTNVLSPWQRKYQYAQSILGSGNENQVGGIDQLIGAAGIYAHTLQSKNKGSGTDHGGWGGV